MKNLFYALFICLTFACTSSNQSSKMKRQPVQLLTIDPGHFHAALVQKKMYSEVDSTVYVYAPEGTDVQDHLNRINGFNTRSENPAAWKEVVYTGNDFLQKMVEDKQGNVLITSGKNRYKIDYILRAVEAGLNVLADKPMIIRPDDFSKLQKVFQTAKEKKVLVYDIMTERHEITTLLQKALSMNKALFGEMEKGSPANPAITKESVHHFFKYVAGNPIKRPAWFFDPEQRGEALVDVSTHLVDLIQWECFPSQIIDYTKEIEILSAKRWSTQMTPAQFEKVTRLTEYPDYLKPYQADDKSLSVYANGEMNYTIRGIHARVVIRWNYQAPKGAGDTHYSIMKGSKANLIIRQGKEENYKPTLYIEPAARISRSACLTALNKGVKELQKTYPTLAVKQTPKGWKIDIPDTYRVGHEAHFGQVTEKFLTYLKEKNMPSWEVPNMLAKYYTTTQAFKKAISMKK